MKDIKKAMRLLHEIKDSGFSSGELKKAFHDLKELNEYRQIGTVEELKHLKEMSEKNKEK